MKKLFIISYLLLLFSCENQENTQINSENASQEIYQPKSVAILTFDLEELSPEGENLIAEWWDFKALYQVFTSIAPTQSLQQNLLQNPDSLSIFKRLHFRSTKTTATNIRVERDWRMGELPTDTIFQLVKNEKEEFTNFGWNEFLLKDIPYTFSLRAKSENFREIVLKIIRQKDKKIITQQTIDLSSHAINKTKTYTKIRLLPDNWIEIKTKITPIIEGEYSFSIHYSENEEANNYTSFYRSELLVPTKYRSDLEKLSNKLISPNSVKSSYNSIYFWLSQVEEEINQLWGKNRFPEKLNAPNIKSRLKLFETYVKELKDNVKNNSNLTNKEILQEIKKIRHVFSAIIRQINSTQSDNLDNKMQQLIEKNPSYDEFLESLEGKLPPGL